MTPDEPEALLDTDLISEIIRTRNAAFALRAESYLFIQSVGLRGALRPAAPGRPEPDGGGDRALLDDVVEETYRVRREEPLRDVGGHLLPSAPSL